MRKRRLGTALFMGAFLSASAQQLSQAGQAIVDAARARYYSLQEKGFVFLACTVHFDTATVPLLPILGTPAQDLLKATTSPHLHRAAHNRLQDANRIAPRCSAANGWPVNLRFAGVGSI